MPPDLPRSGGMCVTAFPTRHQKKGIVINLVEYDGNRPTVLSNNRLTKSNTFRIRSIHGAFIRRGRFAGWWLDGTRVAAAAGVLHAGRPGAPRATTPALNGPRHRRPSFLQKCPWWISAYKVNPNFFSFIFLTRLIKKNTHESFTRITWMRSILINK